jgi:hypothetical protein
MLKLRILARCGGMEYSILYVYKRLFVMYSGIAKIYYRKTVEHLLTKPVQIEGTTQKSFSQ